MQYMFSIMILPPDHEFGMNVVITLQFFSNTSKNSKNDAKRRENLFSHPPMFLQENGSAKSEIRVRIGEAP